MSGSCIPRLPARHFQVKKEGPNKGRWFYTCQGTKESGCGFFLWEEDAIARAVQVVMNNTRFETDGFTTRTDAIMDKTPVPGQFAASNELMEEPGEADDNEYGDWPLSPTSEKKIVHTAGYNDVSNFIKQSDTPSKCLVGSASTTPGGKRKRVEDLLPIPFAWESNRLSSHKKSSRDEGIFSTQSKRMKGGMWDGNERSGIRSPSATPAPSLYRESIITKDDCPPKPQLNCDITDEVMELLKDQYVVKETIESLQKLLKKHALKMLGIAKGRDITRASLKAKDTTIAELQQKINAMHADMELNKTIIKTLKSDMLSSVENRMLQSVANRRSKGGGRKRGQT